MKTNDLIISGSDVLLSGNDTTIKTKKVATKIINLSSDVDSESAKTISDEIAKCNEQDSAENIELRINSYGGDVASAFHIINAVKLSKIPVKTIATGVASSSGLLILLSCKERYGMKESVYLSHKMLGGVWGNDKERDAGEWGNKIFEKVILNHYVSALGKSAKWVKENLLKDFDLWFSPQQAKKLGIITKVI